MATEIEMRHFERDFLFRLYKAKKLGRYEDVIAEMETRMEQDDVKIVKQKLTEWEETKRTDSEMI